MMPDDELAQDMGIFSFDKDNKAFAKTGLQPAAILNSQQKRRNSFDEQDVKPLEAKKNPT